MFRNNRYSNFGSASNGGYSALLSDSRAYIKIDGVETGSYALDGKTTLVARVGPRNTFMSHSYEFNIRERPQNVWDFKYNDAHRSSFVFVLFKKHLFGGDEELGEIELRLGSFEPNTVVTKEYTLKTPSSKHIPCRARISVHLCEDGSSPFCAPNDGKLLSNPEIPHAQTYFN